MARHDSAPTADGRPRPKVRHLTFYYANNARRVIRLRKSIDSPACHLSAVTRRPIETRRVAALASRAIVVRLLFSVKRLIANCLACIDV
ncbi:hypothetical protein EVAR_22806_1 [Eumeta japonica]|uniref:Uncharacterized protein n=1 Tax=Eumeta variegata TaxID=151549 RepID=A0A4C1VEU0_EUMVA|nr:hypothetical protein EVAR_22806_1 [Eumeta japonica]